MHVRKLAVDTSISRRLGDWQTVHYVVGMTTCLSTAQIYTVFHKRTPFFIIHSNADQFAQNFYQLQLKKANSKYCKKYSS